ncbi:hypothetical protein KXW29_006505 [Aspergillus fumigatus]|uniref:Uncharacterized protein n=1 Tax=Aspergillus fumigatus TaxID=746128 RepID=A0A229Y498_ASPFM|nr:hypothetical protein KXX32_006392 [Aspergillus fumigatus]KAH1893415.1 hypothetical protein KXV57_002924 [Aspergillus fumigatus]KAH2266946.1 hypothetical protein KXW02_003757 [Aspergillus fumigatus]KAH2709753.1 hypothetical protein KXW29_006505 [Aspergillus fumigatus]OXN27237.1 hypothetical protein CDV57_06173 [Aspergillus fumigatus]
MSADYPPVCLFPAQSSVNFSLFHPFPIMLLAIVESHKGKYFFTSRYNRYESYKQFHTFTNTDIFRFNYKNCTTTYSNYIQQELHPDGSRGACRQPQPKVSSR